jgi:hypothetical protein
MPAPTGGMNTVDPWTELPPRDCVSAINIIADTGGVRARTGWREHATGITGTINDQVRTTMSFNGSQIANNRLFQTTDDGIWDVSVNPPTRMLTFGAINLFSGWGMASAVVTSGGHFLVYADEVNGLFYYSEATEVWAAYTSGSGTGQISGVDPALIVSVTVWKNRLWLTERNTAKAWYLDAGAIFGTATGFTFGGRFAHGGYLVGLFNWSTDGGSGLDTLLVAISSSGDVVIYVGTDPASASTFGLKGVWFVGAVPAGRRIATDYGGDLLILSALGVIPASKLLIGNPVLDRSQYATGKISNLFSRLANASINYLGWAMVTHPTDNALMVLIPPNPVDATFQLAMSIQTKGWTRYEDLPILSAAVWDGKLYFGTADGRCCKNEGALDEVLLDTPSSGTPIDWSVLMPFHGYASQKQVQMVRPLIVSDESVPAYEGSINYDFDTSVPALPDLRVGGPGTWDYANATGEVTQDTRQASETMAVTLTGNFDFIPDGGFIIINNSETIEYAEWDGSEFTFAGDTHDDHFAKEPVTLPPNVALSDPTGTWDTATWSAGGLASVGVQGAVGMGRDFAVAVRGQAQTLTTLVGVDVLFTKGGFL